MNGKELRAARLNAGLSLRQAVKVIGVPEQSIRRLEQDLGVTPGNAKRIADYFGIQVTDLAAFEAEAA